MNKSNHRSAVLPDDIEALKQQLIEIQEIQQKQKKHLLEYEKFMQIGFLASGFAHNLQSPLTAIKGYAQLIHMDFPEIEEIGLMIEETDVLETIINNLMFISQMNFERVEKFLNLNTIIETNLLFLNSNLFYKHKVKKKVDLKENIPSVRGVYIHYSLPIVNIIENALDAMEQSEEKILSIKTDFDSDYIYIQISDTGCGMSVDIQKHVFEFLFSSKSLLSDVKDEREPRGTGLGLTNAKRYLSRYGGKIHIKSAPGSGTDVTIQIPYSHE